MPTYVPPVKSMPTKWHVIDANGKVLGRVATAAAKMLQGVRSSMPMVPPSAADPFSRRRGDRDPPDIERGPKKP